MWRKLINNRYFRVAVFATLVGVIYYDIVYFMEEYRAPRRTSTGGSPFSPASSPAHPAAGPPENPAQASGRPVSLDYLEAVDARPWGRNPFFTAPELEAMHSPEAEGNSLPSEEQPEPPSTLPDWNLQMVLLAPRGKLAIIDNETYSEGDRIDGARIQEIRPGEVVLSTPLGPRTLRVTRPGKVRVQRSAPEPR